MVAFEWRFSRGAEDCSTAREGVDPSLDANTEGAVEQRARLALAADVAEESQSFAVSSAVLDAVVEVVDLQISTEGPCP